MTANIDYGRPCCIEANQVQIEGRFVGLAPGSGGGLFAFVEVAGGEVARYDLTAQYSLHFKDNWTGK